MSNAMEEGGGSPVDMSAITRVSALLRDAVSSSASPQSLQAFHELTKADFGFMTGQSSVRITDPDVFSEKLKLAGAAVEDPRSFAGAIMLIMQDRLWRKILPGPQRC